MNNARRKAIAKVIQSVVDLQAQIDELAGKLNEIASEIETIKDEEDDYYSNMPESFQNSEKGEAAQTAIDTLDEAYSAAEDAATTLNGATEQIVDALNSIE